MMNESLIMALFSALNVAFGAWGIGWPLYAYAPWVGSFNMFVAGLCASAALNFYRDRKLMQVLLHG